jgi:hypothetical protein
VGPIGVVDLVADEDNCMGSAWLQRLGSGQVPAGISEYLWFELEDHLNIDPTGMEVDSMANRLGAWAAACL